MLLVSAGLTHESLVNYGEGRGLADHSWPRSDIWRSAGQQLISYDRWVYLLMSRIHKPQHHFSWPAQAHSQVGRGMFSRQSQRRERESGNMLAFFFPQASSFIPSRPLAKGGHTPCPVSEWAETPGSQG